MYDRKQVAIALVALLGIGLLPDRAQAQIEAGAAVFCAANPIACGAVLVIVGGVSYWMVTYSDGSTDYFPIEDPEGASEEWSDYVWADDPAQAERKCRQYAETVGAVYVEVRRRGRGPYECIFRSPA